LTQREQMKINRLLTHPKKKALGVIAMRILIMIHRMHQVYNIIGEKKQLHFCRGIELQLRSHKGAAEMQLLYLLCGDKTQSAPEIFHSRARITINSPYLFRASEDAHT
jgi:hypothetical protein